MKIYRSIGGALLLIILFAGAVSAGTNTDALLVAKIQKVLDTANGRIGVGIEGLDFDAHVSLNERQYPMLSVYKFPLAIAILDKVDKGQLSLTQKVHISKQELDTNTWSPMVRDFPDRDIDMTLTDLLRYTVSKSDNNGCDILFRLAGGTRVVNEYIHKSGVRDIAIMATEAQMKTGWVVQYTNWCMPSAMVQLIKLFYDRKVLTSKSYEVLMKMMVESENSPARIKGMLPASAVVAHKTGTSNARDGITAATNDIGIITLPNGRHIAIVVYVSDFKGGTPRGEHMIAEIAKLAWDHYSTNK